MKQHLHFLNYTSFVEGLQKLATLPLTRVDIAVKNSLFREQRKHGKSIVEEKDGIPKSYAKCSSVPRELMMEYL